ncbi:MAG: hypothetical protein AAGJ87_09740 [Pseudomonadota bacterium]
MREGCVDAFVRTLLDWFDEKRSALFLVLGPLDAGGAVRSAFDRTASADGRTASALSRAERAAVFKGAGDAPRAGKTVRAKWRKLQRRVYRLNRRLRRLGLNPRRYGAAPFRNRVKGFSWRGYEKLADRLED